MKKKALLLLVTLTLVLTLCGAVSAGTPLSENQTGTVSGDLYVNTSSTWASTTQGATNEVTQPNTLPAHTSIDSAMVYVNVYSGSGSSNWPVRTTVKLDGNGDGDYDDAGETLGVEDMNIPSSPDGTVYWLNDHCTKVYSDYQVWYNVTGLITCNNPTLYVKTENMGGTSYDGRIKLLALVAAYNDGDNDKVDYWVLNGQDWTTDSSSATFNTTRVQTGFTNATLNTVALSSTDGTYAFNGNSLSGNLTETGSYYKEHNWDVKGYITPGANSTLNYTNAGSSLKMNLATLAVREAPHVDLSIGKVDTVPLTKNVVLAKQVNNVTITGIKNNGPDTATNILVSLYASDVNGGNTPVATTTIASLASGATTSINLIDPTIRNLQGGTVTYIVKVSADGSVIETNETNNQLSSTAKKVVYNGYNGKRYWEGGSDINTTQTYDIRGNIVYYTQPESTYGGGGWTTRTETWTSSNLSVPATGTVQDVWLFLSYNWDLTTGGKPLWTVTLNGQTLDLSGLTPYTDQANYGSFANNKYGLYMVNVTSLYNRNGNNTLVMTSNTGNSQVQAIYPSTMAVIYSDPNQTRKQIFINPECDEVGVSYSSYGNTLEQAIAYANFSGLTIDTTKVSNATLHSFAGSDGPNEGNLFFNGNTVALAAWQGTSNTASALVADVKKYLTSTGNVAAIQGTNSGGMSAIQQFLVVEYADTLPVANFTSNSTSGDLSLNVQFNDTSSGYVTGYAWDFDNDGVVDSTEQNPTHTYSAPGKYTVKLTVTNSAGSDEEVKTDYITVNAPDLIVTGISPNVGAGAYMFANEPNVISVTVKNNGTAAAAASTLNVTVNGTVYTVNVPALAAGASTTVTVTDPVSRKNGDSVPVSAAANPDNAIPETNTSNNGLSASLTVYNNGYKGKRYTDGSDISTQQTFEGRYNVVYSHGNNSYKGSGWTAQTYSWTSNDLPIPAGATVVSARLYQGYTYNQMAADPSWIMQFNGNTVNVLATYSDIKGFGNYSCPYGLYVYDVTSFFNASGNTMNITPEAGNKYGIYGAYLIMVYQDANATEKKIWINDGFDMLYSKSSYSVNDTEATAYAVFNDASKTGVGKASVVNILASAGDTNGSKFFFNNVEYTGFWNDYNGTTQMGFSTYDVTSALLNGTNTAGLQSYDAVHNATSSGDNMYILGSVFVEEYDREAPSVSANPESGPYTTPRDVVLSATDNMDANPVIYYTLDGSDPTTSSTRYNGSIHVTSTTTVKYIVVDAAGNMSPVGVRTYTMDGTAPVVTASPVGGNYYAPQTVTLKADEIADIYYTLDGSTPTKSSTRYAAPISVTSSKKLSYIGVDSLGNISGVKTQVYRIYKLVKYSYTVKTPYKKVWYRHWYKKSYKHWYKSHGKWAFKWRSYWKKGWAYHWKYKNTVKTGQKYVLT